MKTVAKIIFLILLIGLMSCHEDAVIVEGPQGPRGATGLQGPQGATGLQGAPGETGYLFEYTNIDFESPSLEVFLPFPSDFEVLSSDVVLVYLLWGVEDIDGISTDIWRPLQQLVFTGDGLLQYNFDHTLFDTRLFLDTEFPLEFLTLQDTEDWVARVVVVPATYWDQGRTIGSTDYKALEAELGLPSLKERDTPQIDRRVSE